MMSENGDCNVITYLWSHTTRWNRYLLTDCLLVCCGTQSSPPPWVREQDRKKPS